MPDKEDLARINEAGPFREPFKEALRENLANASTPHDLIRLMKTIDHLDRTLITSKFKPSE